VWSTRALGRDSLAAVVLTRFHPRVEVEKSHSSSDKQDIAVGVAVAHVKPDICQHTSLYVRICQYTSAYVRVRQLPCATSYIEPVMHVNIVCATKRPPCTHRSSPTEVMVCPILALGRASLTAVVSTRSHLCVDVEKHQRSPE
jgi:hypothetical protein